MTLNLEMITHLKLKRLEASNCNKWRVLGKIGTFTQFYEYKFSFWTQSIIRGRDQTLEFIKLYKLKIFPRSGESSLTDIIKY